MNKLKQWLGFDPAKSSLKVELMAGFTTFLTMSYILAVNPNILATTGMDKGALFTATALSAAIATLLLAVMAKLPMAQAPSMGLNAFFAFTMCQAMGLTWQQSLTVLLIEGILFLLITVFKVRNLILYCIPTNLRYAISVGIGMFIAFIGLKNAGVIVADSATYVKMGTFTPTAMLGLLSIVLSSLLMARRVKGSLFIAIIITSVVAVATGHVELPDNWSPVAMPQSIAPTFCQFDFSVLGNPKVIMIVISLLLVNVFDSIGTILALADKLGIVRADGTIPHVNEAMLSDAIGTTCASMLGCSTISTYVESASGVAEGGRSGVTSLVTGLLFVVAIFLSPIFLLIPSFATSGALVMVGVLMVNSFKRINFDDMSEAFPSFITIITMVLCYSIADGISLGILSYVFMKLFTGKWRQLNPTICILAVIFIINYAVR